MIAAPHSPGSRAVLFPITHFEWQLLRHLVRAEATGVHPLGRELRVCPTRRTKDGTFLDDLVERGLIAVAAKAPALPPRATPAEQAEPAQFRTRYRLTDRGRHAAEYGEYERPYAPAGPAPLVGLAAEMFGQLDKPDRSVGAPESNGESARRRSRGKK
jgi:hypothetical protein